MKSSLTKYLNVMVLIFLKMISVFILILRAGYLRTFFFPDVICFQGWVCYDGASNIVLCSLFCPESALTSCPYEQLLLFHNVHYNIFFVFSIFFLLPFIVNKRKLLSTSHFYSLSTRFCYITSRLDYILIKMLPLLLHLQSKRYIIMFFSHLSLAV